MRIKELLESLAEVEARIAVIYERFATEFRGVSDISDLWDSMSREEVEHADFLTHAAAVAEDRDASVVVVERLNTLQQLLLDCERDQRRVVSLQHALQLTADLEDAEATYVHAALDADPSVAGLGGNAALQHQLRHLLEHAIALFGTPALRYRIAAQHVPD